MRSFDEARKNEPNRAVSTIKQKSFARSPNFSENSPAINRTPMPESVKIPLNKVASGFRRNIP